MPELPEVETLRLQLSSVLPGLIIQNIEILNSKSFIGEKKLIIGKKIVGVRRFAKMLVVDLSDNFSIVIHLKMSGQLLFKKNLPSRSSLQDKPYGHLEGVTKLLLPGVHTRVMIIFTNGDRLFFNDMRKFGWMRVVQTQNSKRKTKNHNLKLKIYVLEDLTDKFGPEPFRDLTVEKFRVILKSAKRAVKVILMDQEKIAGVGNIYANDALFLSKIHPQKSADKVSETESKVLFHKLLKILKDGIKWGGASKINFVDIYGQKGTVQDHFLVYDRRGENCPNNCGSKIKKIKLGGRGTFFCPRCQKY